MENELKTRMHSSSELLIVKYFRSILPVRQIMLDTYIFNTVSAGMCKFERLSGILRNDSKGVWEYSATWA